jgi:hypothetical protein
MAMTLAEALDRVFANDLGINVGDASEMIEEAVASDAPKAENVAAISNAAAATAEDCATKINAILDALVGAGIMEAASNAEDDVVSSPQ